MTPVRLFAAAACLVAAIGPPAARAAEPTATFQVVPWPENAFQFVFTKNGVRYGGLALAAWGPNWGWVSTPAQPVTGDGGAVDATTTIVFDNVKKLSGSLHERVSSAGPNSIVYRYEVSAAAPVQLTKMADEFTFADGITGSVAVVLANGKTLSMPIPTPRLPTPEADVAKLVFHVAGIGDVSATFDPPVRTGPENGHLRMELAHAQIEAGSHPVTMTLAFPGPVSLVASKAQLDAHTVVLGNDPTWFAWQPANDPAPGEIGMQTWLDGPAGKYGAVTINGDHFQLANGSPIKFWGTNLGNNSCDPPKEKAVATAAYFAKYGINCVRLHKFMNPGWEGMGSRTSSTVFQPDQVDRFDYFTAELKKQGIYYGWSPNFHYKVRPDDASRLLAPDELKALGNDTYGVINGAPDIQDLMIDMVTTLLKHRNPYTGLTYAEDPAMAFVETQNEDDIFFYTFSIMDKCPKYKQAMRQRFAAFLKRTYGTQDSLAKAWGAQLLKSETIDGSVDFSSNPWMFSDDSLKGTDDFKRRRLLDTAMFFDDEQAKFYGKFKAAVAAIGYKGPVIGSPWWAPTTLPQYLNLRNDAASGLVDRHNYFDDSHNPIFASMLGDPGSGYLNTGLLQVAGHPFSQSEWCHVWPNLYRAEGPTIMAAYAMGLQGWDASYEFASEPNGVFRSTTGNLPWSIWNVDVPSQIGQYPALSRMVYRGDVKEAAPIAVKRVSSAGIAAGKFDFSDTATVSGDVKSFTGSVPQSALAAGKTLVEFTDATVPSTFPDMSKYDVGKVITSTTKQLQWDYSGKGYFTIDTPSTVGIVGFAQDKLALLAGGQIRMRMRSPYGVAIVTSLDPKSQSLVGSGRKALVTVLGRECSAGFSYFDLDSHRIADGKAPIMEEGVSANLSFLSAKIASVNVLDQDGRLQPGKAIKSPDGHSFAVNTADDKTIYYEVVFE